MARPRSTTLEAPGDTGEPQEAEEGVEGQVAPPDQGRARGGSGRPPLQLPTERTQPSGRLEDKTIMLYGPPKIGKSTLASEFGDVLFADTEGGLKELAVFPVEVTDWLGFLDFCALAVKSKEKHPVIAIDTLDHLALYCSAHMNKRMGVVHESDLEYGKGWSIVRAEMSRALAKLTATPDLGVILISHSKDVEIKQRNRTITKAVPDLPKFAREISLALADLILYVDYEGEGDEEHRVIRTKPSAFWEAGERGNPPRLPAAMPWPIGQGYETLARAWNGETK